MSFFDETDEPSRTEVRTPSRPSPRRRNSGGSGSGGRRRPPSGAPHQSILARRAVAVVALIVVVVLIAVGVNSCQSSARKSALQDYANNVNSLVARSDSTSKSLFKALEGSSGSSASQISQSVNSSRAAAQTVLADAQGLSAPSAAKTADAHLVLAMQMRLDGITGIAAQIQPALASSVGQQAVTSIATDMARFYASDVLYKDYAAPALVSALHANKIAVGGESGVPVNAGQFLPNLNWLTPSYVGGQLGVALSGSGSGGGKTPKGLHGHSLTTVSVGGSELTAGGSNTIAASPTPTFTLDFANGGNFNETDVTCKVTVTGTSASGTKVVPETFAGKTASCAVTLTSPPPRGNYNVVATIEKVPGEANTQNNTLSFPVTFN